MRPSRLAAPLAALVLGALLAAAAPVAARAQDAPDPAPDHAAWTALLETYVSERPDGLDLVDYAAWRADAEDRRALEAYVDALEAARPSALSEDAAFAYWANLYNAVTVRLILEEAPSRSIRQIKPHPFAIGPWGVERVTVEGEALSLDDIEHGIMRPRFEAAMVHYAVNCASIGCPDIGFEAWTAEDLDARLEAAAREYVNHPRGVSVGEDGLTVSSIYTWFQEDFGGDEAGVIDHLLRFAEPELAAAIRANPRIDDYAYDWALNRPQ